MPAQENLNKLLRLLKEHEETRKIYAEALIDIAMLLESVGSGEISADQFVKAVSTKLHNTTELLKDSNNNIMG